MSISFAYHFVSAVVIGIDHRVADISDFPGLTRDYQAAMQRDATSDKKKPRLVATGFGVENMNSLDRFELAPNDSS